MQNPRLAGRYAKSLLDLSIENNQLESIHADIRYLQSICAQNRDFVEMLKSPVITSDKKEKILEAVTSGKITELTHKFLKLLIIKTREYSLTEIVKSFIEQYNKLNGIHQIKLTTAVPVSKELKDSIVEKIKSTTNMKKIELEVAVLDDLIGGFTLEVGDTLVDASILRDLNDVKKQFQNNQFIHSLH